MSKEKGALGILGSSFSWESSSRLPPTPLPPPSPLLLPPAPLSLCPLPLLPPFSSFTTFKKYMHLSLAQWRHTDAYWTMLNTAARRSLEKASQAASLLCREPCAAPSHSEEARGFWNGLKDVQSRLLDSVGEGEGGMFRENSIETNILSRVKQTTSPGWMHETSAQGWCTGKTQRDGMGREVGGGLGWGTHVNPWLIHVSVCKNHYNIVK